MLPIEKLLISPCFLICIVFSVALIGWLFTVKLFTPSEKFWQISNFLGLTLTCLGIFGILKDSRQIFYEREYNKCQQRIESVYRWRIISELNPELYSREFNTTEYSSNNLNTIQEDYNRTCQWIKDNKEYIFTCYSNENPIIVDSINFPKLRTSGSELKDYFKNLQKCITDYNKEVVELRRFEQGMNPNTYELLYVIFSPFFLAIGLGWEFVKFFAKR